MLEAGNSAIRINPKRAGLFADWPREGRFFPPPSVTSV